MIDDTIQSLPVAETPTNNAADSSQQVGPFTAFDYAGPWTPHSMEDILSWAASGYYFAVIPHAATTLDVDVMEALKTGLRFGVTHYMYCTVLPKDSPAPTGAMEESGDEAKVTKAAPVSGEVCGSSGSSGSTRPRRAAAALAARAAQQAARHRRSLHRRRKKRKRSRRRKQRWRAPPERCLGNKCASRWTS